ncbi:MAG: hypothetical protein WCQ44_11925 [Opitutaceae bacterium]
MSDRTPSEDETMKVLYPIKHHGLSILKVSLLLGTVGLISAIGLRGAEALIDLPRAKIRLALVEKYWGQGMNDGVHLAAARQAMPGVQLLINAGQLAEALAEIERLEREAGITAGGTLMFGQRVYHPTPTMQADYEKARRRLERAMQGGEEVQVGAAVAALQRILGDQAGLTEMPLPGMRAAMHPLSEAEVTALFVRALKNHAAASKLAAGTPIRTLEPRAYASLVMAICSLREAIARNQAEDLALVDTVVRVSCNFLAQIQQPDGHLPTPDVRGKNASITDLLQNQANQNPGMLQDGFFIGIPADGSVQFDNGEGGLALLCAAECYNHPHWRAAGLRAAAWTLTQPCVRNFNYNAFSLALCARAYAATQERKYLDFALRRWRTCLAPGQMQNGRWVDPHNAKTVYHLIILRAAQELLAVIPLEETLARGQLLRATEAGVKSVIDEFEHVGVTNFSYALGALVRQEKLDPQADPRLRATIELTASVAYAKASRTTTPSFGVQPLELAMLVQAWGKRGANPRDLP